MNPVTQLQEWWAARQMRRAQEERAESLRIQAAFTKSMDDHIRRMAAMRPQPTGSVIEVGADFFNMAPPQVAQEQFAENRVQDLRPAHQRVIATNNRNVTRDYGHGPVDETRPMMKQELRDADDATEADLAAIGAKVYEKKAPRMVAKEDLDLYLKGLLSDAERAMCVVVKTER